MTRYNSLNLKLSNSQLNKLKLIKNETGVVLRLSSRYLLINRQLILCYEKLSYLK